jgi:kumamolisin
MKCRLSIVVAMVALLSFAAMAQDVDRTQGKATNGTTPQAAARGPQDWIVPEGSIERPEDAGVRAHTDIVFRSLDGSEKPTLLSSPAEIPTFPLVTTNQVEQTPQSLGCIYLDSPKSTGCVPNYGKSHGPSKGGSGAIAVIEAGDDPTAATDLVAFDKYWGLATATFVKIKMTNSCSTPPACSNFGWCAEDALDEEYAHVYAPSATIIMVEACSSSYSDLLAANEEAFDYIATNYPQGQVSNSWGSGEFSGEGSYNADFTTWGYGLYGYAITAFASAGDSGCGAAYPSSNPWLVSAGGSSIYNNASGEAFVSEGCWSGSGGGTSTYETWAPTVGTGNNPPFNGDYTGPWTNYQYPIFGESARATPDFGFNSDPDSGVALYSITAFGGWSCCWGGTSEASPSLAAIVNRAGNKLSTCYFNPVNGTCYFSNAEDTLLYSQLPTAVAYSVNFYSPNSGSNGCTVSAGWDYCTGVGTPRGILGK